MLLNISFCFGVTKYEVVKCSGAIQVGSVLDHTDVSPILKVENDGSLTDFEGNSFKIIKESNLNKKEDGGNFLLYAILLILIIIGFVFFKKKK